MTTPHNIQDPQRHGGESLRGGVLRAGRVGLRMLAAVALIGGSVAFAGLTDNSSAAATDSVGCDGVTVVVDFTDLGGELQVNCAEGEQESGRTALLAAGFTATDSQPGFLCAINSMPDPCPETFEGVYWSYWFVSDGAWISYQVGADSSTPVTGSIEGWRYNDGATAPGIAPAAVTNMMMPSDAPAPETSEPATPGSDEAVTSSTLEAQQAEQNMVLTMTVVAFLALIAALVIFFGTRKRRKNAKANSVDAGNTGTNSSETRD